jgi:hypothetical protein
LDRFLLNVGASKAQSGVQRKGPKFMQRVVAAFPKQAQLPNDYLRTSEPDLRSGFFSENTPALAKSELAAAIVLAVHRRLIEQPARKNLPLR